MTEPAKLLLLASILAKGRVISSNGKAFLKELILRRDPRLLSILASFDSNMDCKDSKFLDTLNSVIGKIKKGDGNSTGSGRLWVLIVDS